MRPRLLARQHWARHCSRTSTSATSTSDVYTHGHHDSVVSQHAARTAANSAAFLLPHLPRGSAVLDVGCGPGSITVGLARHVGPDGCVTGIDLEPAVLQQAAAAARASGLRVTLDGCSSGPLGPERSGSVQLACESAYELRHADSTFDCAYAHQTLQHLRRPVDAIREMARVVRPGGVLALRDADYASMRGWPDSPGLGGDRLGV